MFEKPDFAAIQAFVQVAKHGNFTRAANALGVTASALSQTIKGLERRLDVQLLNRTSRRVGVTELGMRFLEQVTPALAQISSAVAGLGESRLIPRGALRISLSRAAAIMIFRPILRTFSERYPEIDIELSINDGLVDIIESGFDAGVRLGERLEQDMVAVRASGLQRMIIVASPDYLARHGQPATPRDVLSHACIRYRYPTSETLHEWEFIDGNQIIKVPANRQFICNDGDFALSAAKAGLGLTQTFEALATEDLRAGRLVELLKPWSPTFPGFYLYYPANRHLPLKLRALIDFLAEHLNQS